MTERRPLRIAIVGSGPAGLYAAGHLLSGPHGTYLDGEVVDLHDEQIEVDVYERLPTPWGLVRGGVAPDHAEKKLVSTIFNAIAARKGFRFFGNVELGRDVHHGELAEWYDGVIYAVGAAGDNRMGIDGEELPGSHSAREFVSWYNGHPDQAEMQFDLSAERAVVIGNGNVALDIARILTLPDDELRRTDIADHALEVLRHSSIREVIVLGRRGLNQAAFNNPELEGLGELKDVDIAVEGVDLGSATTTDVDVDVDVRRLTTIRSYLERPQTGTGKRIVLHFMASPIQIHGTTRVDSVTIARNELIAGPDGSLRARSTTDTTTLPAGLVLRAVGYRGAPVAGLPFDQHTGTIPNEGGRVVGSPGVYVTGWIKRGPSGIIGTNKKCARDTVRALLEDHRTGNLPTADTLSGAQVTAEFARRQVAVVTDEQWKAIDRHERRAGAYFGRPRIKLTSRSALLDRANSASAAGER